MSMISSCTTQAISAPSQRFRIIPAGLFRAHDGRPYCLQGWFMNGAAAQRIIATAIANKRDYLIDYEHQTLNAQSNTGAVPAAGWFKHLQWIEGDGLYVTDARWTAQASSMISSKEYRYISPVFSFDSAGNVTGLHSIALTNNPALDGLTDLAAASRQLPSTSHSGITDKDHAMMQHIFGKDYVREACLNTGKQAALTANVSLGGGISASDDAKLRHFFGEDYAKNI